MFGTSRARVTVNFKRTRSLVDLERVMLNARDGNALQSVNIYLLLQHFADISVGSAEYLCWIAAIPTVYSEGLLRLVVPEETPAIKVYRPLSNLVVKWIGAGQNRVIF